MNCKEKYINLAIAIITYILSIALGFILGAVALCTGTTWLHARTEKAWKYNFITAGLNIITSFIITFIVANKLGIFQFNSEYEEAFAIVVLYPAIILLFIILIAVTIARFLLQCLCCYLVKKYFDKKRKNIVLNLNKTS